MTIAIFVVATILALHVIVACYMLAMAAAGTWVGATVQGISIGVGPRLLRGKCFGSDVVVRLVPFLGYTKFLGKQDEEESADIARKDRAIERPASIAQEERHAFAAGESITKGSMTSGTEAMPLAWQDVHPLRRVFVLLVGPLTSLLLGMVLVQVAVVCQSPQLQVTTAQQSQVVPCGIEGIAIDSEEQSTIRGQGRFLRNSVGTYFWRFLTFQSLEGWGGCIGCLVTCALVVNLSTIAWITCIGTLALANGIFNLLPIPTLNGGHILVITSEAITGWRVPLRLSVRAHLIGSGVMLFILGRILWQDITWLWSVL